MNSMLISWDCKEQPDWDEINSALVKVASPQVYVLDTLCDSYFILVAPKGLTDEAVLAEAAGYFDTTEPNATEGWMVCH